MKPIRVLCVALSSALLFGCGVKVPPQLLDCRTFGCKTGFECKPTAKPEDSALWACVEKSPCVPDFTVVTDSPAVGKWSNEAQECGSRATSVTKHTTNSCTGLTVDEITTTNETKLCPTPPPPPVSACAYPAAEGQLVALNPQPVNGDSRGSVILAGTRALGDLRDPKRNGTSLSRENNRKLAAWLRGSGYCAFAGQEAVFITSADLLWLEYHATGETDGGWTQTPYRGVHRNEGPTVNEAPDMPEIPDVPPVVEGCGEPTPPPLGRIGVSRTDIRDGWEKFDATPLTAEGNLDYCTSVGFVGRASCPPRLEGADTGRLACERYMLRGDAPLFVWTGAERDGGLWPGNDTGFTFEHRKGSSGSLKVCDAKGETCNVLIP